jgi:hypothetical protein
MLRVSIYMVSQTGDRNLRRPLPTLMLQLSITCAYYSRAGWGRKGIRKGLVAQPVPVIPGRAKREPGT